MTATLLIGLCLFTVLPPAVQDLRGVTGRRALCVNNLQMIGFALAEYEMRTGSPPPVVADKRGNPMHSWRTLILPHMEQGALYRTYNFGEPWNGPDNGKLTSAPLRCYCCPSDPSVADRPMTSYVAVTGPGTVWDEHHLTVAPPRVIVFEVVDSGIQWRSRAT